MASKVSAPVVFLFSLNLLFFTLVSSQSPPPHSAPPPTPILTPSPAPPPTLLPTPPPPPSPSPPATCNRPLNLALCANLIGMVRLNVTIPRNPGSRCCSTLIGVGSTNLQIGTCLCIALRANVLGIVDLNLATNALLSSCGRPLPSGFRCP